MTKTFVCTARFKHIEQIAFRKADNTPVLMTVLHIVSAAPETIPPSFHVKFLGDLALETERDFLVGDSVRIEGELASMEVKQSYRTHVLAGKASDVVRLTSATHGRA